jgi:hypothetical protein
MRSCASVDSGGRRWPVVTSQGHAALKLRTASAHLKTDAQERIPTAIFGEERSRAA